MQTNAETGELTEFVPGDKVKVWTGFKSRQGIVIEGSLDWALVDFGDDEHRWYHTTSITIVQRRHTGNVYIP